MFCAAANATLATSTAVPSKSLLLIGRSFLFPRAAEIRLARETREPASSSRMFRGHTKRTALDLERAKQKAARYCAKAGSFSVKIASGRREPSTAQLVILFQLSRANVVTCSQFFATTSQFTIGFTSGVEEDTLSEI